MRGISLLPRLLTSVMLALAWALGMHGLASASQAATQPLLLWVTSDITPAGRTALVERLGSEAGFRVLHVEQKLQGETVQAVTATRRAAADAAWIWVDAPHATVRDRLQSLLSDSLPSGLASQPVVWITDTPAAGSRSQELPQRIAAYLQAGGEGNLRSAFALARAFTDGRESPPLAPPEPWPARGLYHPAAPGVFADAAAFERWRGQQLGAGALPTVAVLVHRHHFVNGTTDWLDAWLQQFRAQGLLAYAVFAPRLDEAELKLLLETQPGVAHPRVLVLHQLISQGAAMQPLFERWGIPLLATQPYRSGDTDQWERDVTGLPLADVPFYLAQPEAAGAIDPLPVLAYADRGRRPELIDRQAQAVASKARRLIDLRDKAPGQRRLVAMVYNYPPGGTNFGASFLNVPRSLQQVSGALAVAGYATGEVREQQWIDGLAPMLAAYYPGADLRALLATGQAAAWPLHRYQQRLLALPRQVRERIEAHWGAAGTSRYVVQWQGEPVFVIPRMQVGQLSVLPQPPREETLQRGRNPFMHRSQAPLSHHYLAVYFWAQEEADALIHFGTHGTQEWAPGKSRALDVLDDALLALGDLPVVYPYIVDNLGEALTAKRRGRATLVSHRTPTLATTGFSAGMHHMHELMHQWETVDEGPTRRALQKQLVAQFTEHRLDKDLGWRPERITREFEAFLEVLHPYLDELAQSSQPRGLAVFGQVPDAAARRQTVLQALRQPLLQALGEDIDEAFLIDYEAVARSRPARWLELALRDPVAASTLDLRPPQPEGYVPNRAARQPIDSAALLRLAQRAQHLERLLATEGELPGLLAALEGRFLPAAYGGDPIRQPDSHPTGRNLTGLDPSRLPTRQAYEVAQKLFDEWLAQWRAQHGGAMPTRLALSLWAGETLRHHGVMEAQALVALGVRPRWADDGRPQGVEVVPAHVLGRPRVDVVLSVTGSYRDQFPSMMALLDQGVAAARGAEPGNPIVLHTDRLAQQLRARGMSAEQAQALAQARVFGNAPGDYGTGISEAVQDDRLQRHDVRLGAMFLDRMSQPYLGGEPLQLPAGQASRHALAEHLRGADAALMSRSSHVYAMVSSDDPFQYLGGLAAASRSAGRLQPLPLYVSQLHDASEAATVTAQRSIAMEMQSRYLHPGWLKAQKAEGYAGTLQVLKAVQFTWGWQSIAPGMVRPDHWQSLHDVLVRDRHQLGLPGWLRTHPQAYAQTLERLVQAQRHGYWTPDAARRNELARLYGELTRGAPLAEELPGVRRWVEGVTRPVLPPPNAPATLPAVEQTPPRAAATGILLQRQPAQSSATANPVDPLVRTLAWLIMAGLGAAGAAWQATHRSNRAA